MGNLTDKYVQDTYIGLIKLNNAEIPLQATLQPLTDGLGNQLPIQVSQTEVVLTGATVTGALIGSASYASNAGSVLSASYATTASYVPGITTPNDGQVYISGSNGLTGNGSFTVNQASGTTITLEHGDTSSQPSIDGSGNTVIQDVTLDTFGHIIGLGTTTITSVASATSSSYALSSSYAANATSASYSISSSYAFISTTAQNAVNATSASYSDVSISSSYANNATSSSYALNATSSSYALNATTASHSLTTVSSSYALNASNATSASYSLTSTSASYAVNSDTTTSASYSLNSTSASYANVATSSSYALNATTSSFSLASATSSYVDYTNIDNLPDFDNLYADKEFWDNANSSARLWGGLITDNGDGTVAIAAGAGLVKAEDAGPEDVPTGATIGQASALSEVTWNAVASLPLADEAYNYIYYNYDTDSITATTNFYSISFTQDFTLGRAYRSGNDIVVRLCGTNFWNFNRRVQLFGEEVFPIVRGFGINIADEGSRQFSVTEGVLWAELVNRFSVDAFDSSIGNTFTYWYRDGGAGFTSVTGNTQINNTQYDNGTGTLATLSNNKYGVHWVYEVHDSSMHVVYGRGDYSLSEAQNASAPSTLPGLLDSYATLIGKITILKSATELLEVASAFDQTFTTSTATNHNDLGGLQGGISNEYYHLTAAQVNGLVSGSATTLHSHVSTSYSATATSASYAAVATSASYAGTATSASYALNATTASFAGTATSASYAVNADTGSYVTLGNVDGASTMAALTFWSGSQAAYDAISGSADGDTLYFITA